MKNSRSSFGKAVLRKISLTDPSVFVIDDYDDVSATSSCSEDEEENFDPDMILDYSEKKECRTPKKPKIIHSKMELGLHRDSSSKRAQTIITITSPRRGRIDPALFGVEDLTNVQVSKLSTADFSKIEKEKGKEKKLAVSMEAAHPLKKEIKYNLPLSKLKEANPSFTESEPTSISKRSGGSLFSCVTTPEINEINNTSENNERKRKRRVKSLTLRRKDPADEPHTRDAITRATISHSDASFPDTATVQKKKKRGKSGLKKKKKKKSALIDQFLRDSPRGESPKCSPKSSPRYSPKSSPKKPKESPKKSPKSPKSPSWSPKSSPKGSPKKLFSIPLPVSPVRKRKTSLSIVTESSESLSPKDKDGK